MDSSKWVYFARSMKDYGTAYEKQWIDNISDNVIDISEAIKQIRKEDKYKVYGEDLYTVELKYFFPLIDKCDYVVAAPAWNHLRRGKFTAGVVIEIQYALSIGKKVFGIVNGTMKQITEDDINET